jgi:hypothetical protein
MPPRGGSVSSDVLLGGLDRTNARELSPQSFCAEPKPLPVREQQPQLVFEVLLDSHSCSLQ